jgi:uncharacterized protein
MASLSISHLTELLSVRTWHLVIIPTEQCNFRCTYCYERSNQTAMKHQIGEAVKALISQRMPDLDTLYVGWFGGEPLLARRRIVDISHYIRGLTQSYPRLSYRAGMATNGYLLTPSLVSELVELGISDYQITLDGPQQIHDQRRPTVNGKGTFDRIWKNLVAMRDRAEQVRILLRIHFDPSRISHLGALIEDVRREFLPDRRFTIDFQAIKRLGGKDDDKIEVFSAVEEQRRIKMLQGELHKDRNRKGPKERPYVCYASRPNSLVIYPNGDLGKCTVALYNPINRIGSINKEGTVSIDSDLLKPWLRGFMGKPDLSILQCPLKNFPKAPGRGANRNFASDVRRG